MYRAPLAEIAFTLKHVAGLPQVRDAYGAEELGEDLVEAILTEAGRFAAEEIAPLNKIADRQGTPFANGTVTTPEGWRDCYHHWIDGGWNALAATTDFGGQGLPVMLNIAALEMWNSASMAFALGPTLTMGAVEALEKHAAPELQEKYLAKLVSGEWMGTMNLTEPQAGSDLNALKARAERNADGSYRIFGQKIYITYGEHDLTDNIIHLVLARLPDAPAGTRGISLFLVPKFFVNDDGSLGARNDVRCAGIEHKLGIHGSPTCTMIYGDEGGATGWLIGEENRGLACMFTMMNNARLAVGVQGLGVSERAFQQALAYALDRRQGRAPGDKGEGMSPIALHPDIKRTLLAMQARTQVARAICYSCAHAIDMAHLAATPEERAHWASRAGLLTPIAKALSTDFGVESASLGVQVHGGMGFIEETGAAQHLRDARITPIYEGTTAIQANDLIGRKIAREGGETAKRVIADMRDTLASVQAVGDAQFDAIARALESGIAALESGVDYLLATYKDDIKSASVGSVPFLKLLGIVAGGWQMARAALVARTKLEQGGVDEQFMQAKIVTSRFYADHVLSQASGLAYAVVNGAAGALALSEEQFQF